MIFKTLNFFIKISYGPYADGWMIGWFSMVDSAAPGLGKGTGGMGATLVSLLGSRGKEATP